MNPSAVSIISKARDAEDLLLRISALINKELSAGKALVFFDEIQEFGDILTWAKFLAERSEHDYIFSGSLLGVELFGIRSWPVGFLDELTMFPLTFEEFCLASGTPRALVELAKEAIVSREGVPDFIHQKLRHKLFYYANTRRGEVDFVCEDQSTGTVPLVEVKSGKTYKRHVALDNLMAAGDYEFDEAIVLCNANVEIAGGRTYLPIYAVGLI